MDVKALRPSSTSAILTTSRAAGASGFVRGTSLGTSRDFAGDDAYEDPLLRTQNKADVGAELGLASTNASALLHASTMAIAMNLRSGR